MWVPNCVHLCAYKCELLNWHFVTKHSWQLLVFWQVQALSKRLLGNTHTAPFFLTLKHKHRDTNGASTNINRVSMTSSLMENSTVTSLVSCSSFYVFKHRPTDKRFLLYYFEWGNVPNGLTEAPLWSNKWNWTILAVVLASWTQQHHFKAFWTLISLTWKCCGSRKCPWVGIQYVCYSVAMVKVKGRSTRH